MDVYLNVCHSDMYSVVINMYIDHLRFGVMCINGQRYDCRSKCYVVSIECDEPTPAFFSLLVCMVVKL